MTKSPKPDYSDINIDKVLESLGQVAVIWSIEDVQGVRPDLSANQAWDVLKECRDKHDCEWGFTWTYIKDMADILFPLDDEESLAEQGA